ncbi:MAG: hypothetical protein U0736_02225 [Gemmataceae bacterium]
MLNEPGQPARELNRLDIHNRTPLPAAAEDRLLALLEAAWHDLDGLIVLDQVSQPDCGVVTARVATGSACWANGHRVSGYWPIAASGSGSSAGCV